MKLLSSCTSPHYNPCMQCCVIKQIGLTAIDVWVMGTSLTTWGRGQRHGCLIISRTAVIRYDGASLLGHLAHYSVVVVFLMMNTLSLLFLSALPMGHWKLHVFFLVIHPLQCNNCNALSNYRRCCQWISKFNRDILPRLAWTKYMRERRKRPRIHEKLATHTSRWLVFHYPWGLLSTAFFVDAQQMFGLRFGRSMSSKWNNGDNDC